MEGNADRTRSCFLTISVSLCSAGRCLIEVMRKVWLTVLIASAAVGLFAAWFAFVHHPDKFGGELRGAVSRNPGTPAPTREPSVKMFLERVKTISGKEAKDCGTTSSTKPDASVSACGLGAFHNHKAFFLGYFRQDGAEPWFAYGLASNSLGDVFMITYRFSGFPAMAPNRHTQLLDDNHTRVMQCISPVTLDTTDEGLPACVMPVNRKESGRVVDQKPVNTTICAVLENPAAFNNKLVRIRGHFSGNFEYSTLGADDCDGSLWFEYGGGGGPPSLAIYVSGAARPGSQDSQGKRILPIPVNTVQDAKLKRFEKQTVAMARADADWERKHPNQHVSHCVTATFVGRIDAVSAEIHEFRKKHSTDELSDGLGFGQMGLFEAQLVVQSVVDDALLGRCKN